MVYKISIESECKSKAKLLRGKKKTEKFLLGDNYEIKFKFKNVGTGDFPGGKAIILIQYTSGQSHFFRFDIQEVKTSKELIIDEESTGKKIVRSALGAGYALFFGFITSNDGELVNLIKYGQDLSEVGSLGTNASFGAIFIEKRNDVYSYYSLLVSAGSLFVLVIFSLIQLILQLVR